MYRLLAFMLMCGVLAFGPARVLAQDNKDKPAGDDKKAAEDKKADEPKKTEEAKKTDEPKKADEPKPAPAEVKPTIAEAKSTAEPVMVPHEPTFFEKLHWPGIDSIAGVVAPLAAIFILAIIAIVLMGLRSDINRLADLVTSQVNEKKEG